MNKKKLGISLLAAAMVVAPMSTRVFAEEAPKDVVVNQNQKDDDYKNIPEENKVQVERARKAGIKQKIFLDMIAKAKRPELAKNLADELIKSHETSKLDKAADFKMNKKVVDEIAKDLKEMKKDNSKIDLSKIDGEKAADFKMNKKVVDEIAKDLKEMKKTEGKIDWSKIDGEKAAEFKMDKKVVDEIAKDLKEMKKTAEEKKTPEVKKEDKKDEFR